MNLTELLKYVEKCKVENLIETNINSIHYDSRQVKPDSLFFCIEGLKYDGHTYAHEAALNGAKAVVLNKDVLLPKNIVKIFVPDSREAMALIAKAFYSHPSDSMNLFGVTGTNGKTTVTYLIKSILEASGKKTGLIGTLGTLINNQKVKTERTTPESVDLQKILREILDSGAHDVAMEVSSHSLSLKRVAGCIFKTGIFTNLTRDHLDFHSTFENYRNAKASIFDQSLYAIINVDDVNGRSILNGVKCETVTYGIEQPAHIYARNIEITSRGVKFNLHIPGGVTIVNLSVPGLFSVYNGLAAAASMYAAGISADFIKSGLEKVKGVPGRFELLETNTNYSVIIDYAHTPDGLENILTTARNFAKGKIITLFGCGGDRDASKRPIMGEVAAKYSDLCIVTSDNPRTEEPINIIEQILPGVKKYDCTYIVEENRRLAIEKALFSANEGDVVILAGKGHETYQIFRDRTIHFDEREVVSEILQEMKR